MLIRKCSACVSVCQLMEAGEGGGGSVGGSAEGRSNCISVTADLFSLYMSTYPIVTP
jgi:hypothetical protein